MHQKLKEERRFFVRLSLQQKRVVKELLTSCIEEANDLAATPENLEKAMEYTMQLHQDIGLLTKEQISELRPIVNQLCKLIAKLP